MMRKKKIFTPIIAVGLAMSLSSVYAENTLIDCQYDTICRNLSHQSPTEYTPTLLQSRISNTLTFSGNQEENILQQGDITYDAINVSGTGNILKITGNQQKLNSLTHVYVLSSLNGEGLDIVLSGESWRDVVSTYVSLTLSEANNVVNKLYVESSGYWGNGTVYLKKGRTKILNTVNFKYMTNMDFFLDDTVILESNFNVLSEGTLSITFNQGQSTIKGNIQRGENLDYGGGLGNVKLYLNNTDTHATFDGFLSASELTYRVSSTDNSSINLQGDGDNEIDNINIGGIFTLKGKRLIADSISLGSPTFQNTYTSTQTLSIGNTITLDAQSNDVEVEVNKAMANPIPTLTLGGTSSHSARINFYNCEYGCSQITTTAIQSITLSNQTQSSQNIIGIYSGTLAITNPLNVSANQGITFAIGDSALLDFQGGLTTSDSGTTTFELGNSTLTTATTTISGTITNTATNIFNINARNTALQYGTSGLSFSSGTNEINFANPSGATLNWKNSSATTQAISTSGTSTTTINFQNNGIILGGVSTSGGETNIEIWNANATLYNIPSENYALKTTGGSASIDFKETLGSFSGNLLANGGNNSITFAKDGTFGFNSILSTDSASTNTFTIDKNITISNNLSVEGIGNNNVGTIPQQAYGTFINIANNSSLALSNNEEKTSITTNGNGATTLAFQGNSGSFSGKLIANFSSKSGRNLISFAQSGSFGFDAILDAQQGYNRMEITQDITITTDIYATGASDESVDRGNSFIINNDQSLTLNSDNSKKTIYTQGGETTLSFQKTGSFSGNLNTSNGLLELDFKTMETGDYTIDLDTDFYASANGENRIRYYDSTRNLILRSEGGFSFRGEGNGNNSIFIGSSNSKISFTNKSNATQTLTYNGGENTITFANTGQTLEANILNTQGNLTFVFGSNEKGITIGQATINGNITANGGNNAFSFLYDSSTPNNSPIPNAPALSDPTLSMGAGSQIIANSTSTNTFTIDKNITFLTDLTLSGNATGNGGNIFNISSGKNLVLQDSSSAIKTLYTTGGQSKITFEGNGNLVANLSTSGGVATFNLGTIQNTKTHLRTLSTLITKGSYTITDGKNIFNLNLPSSILEMQDGNGNALALQTNGGETEFNFNSSNELKVASLTTSSGDTKINFNSQNNTLTTTSGISTTSGNTTIALSSGASGRIIGSFEKTGGSNILDFSNNSHLTLTGANNTITQINGLSSIQSATLTLDSSSNALNALISSPIIGNSLILDFQGGNTDAQAIHLTLSGNNNALKDIAIVGTKNTLTLNFGNTSIAQGLLIQSGGIVFDIKDGANLTFAQDATSDTSLGMQFDFYGSSNIDGIIHTTENGALHGTVINLKNNANATFKKAIQTDDSASSVVNFESINNQASLTLEATNNTISEFNILDNTSGILKGKGVEISVFTLGENTSANFTLANSSSTIDNLTTSFQGNTLTLDSSETNVALSIKNPISDNKLVLNFKSQNNTTRATLENAGNTLYALRIESGSKNTLALSKGNTTISSKVTIGKNQEIAFDMSNNSSLSFTSGLSTEIDGNATFNLGGTNTLSGTFENNGANIFNINAKNVTLQSGADGLSFSGGNNEINFTNISDAILSWKDSGGSNLKAISTTAGNTNINFNKSGTIIGGVETNSGSGGITNINISDNATGTIGGAITLGENGGSNNVLFKGSNGGLILKGNATLTSLNSQGSNNAISLHHNNRGENNFKTLIIGTKGDKTTGISGNGLNFLVYAISNAPEVSPETQPNARGGQDNTPKVYADKIIIHSSSNKEATTHTLGVVFENQDALSLGAISYTKGADNNILIASVSDSSKVSFNTQSTQVLGFDVAQIDYVRESTDENGNISGSGYTSYFVGKAKATEVVVAEQEITATAFTLNYDLYMANLNSLNKRMGELRDNAHSQGVWARVFNGALSNEFGLGSKSNYTTIQAGYDYAFGFEGANNYLGVALSYALSTSTSQNAFDENGQRRGIDGIYSNAIEVALYNSYVSDSGWYNDSIAKFSYIMSKFDINNLNDNTSTSNDTSNFALTFGDEVGYVFKLGETKEWSITPQVEATFGYFSQSDFKQTLANSNIYLNSMAENVLTLRARVGSAFAYDFKNFTQKDAFNASLYIGAFYEYDYVSGGEIKMNTQRETQTNKYSNLSSDGRVVMNVGTNMSIQDHTRLYFDFEKSFAGKINTDYQVNFGVRYSFGESNGYAPMIEKTESKSPLKVEEESKEEQGSNEIKEEQESEKK